MVQNLGTLRYACDVLFVLTLFEFAVLAARSPDTLVGSRGLSSSKKATPFAEGEVKDDDTVDDSLLHDARTFVEAEVQKKFKHARSGASVGKPGTPHQVSHDATLKVRARHCVCRVGATEHLSLHRSG